MNTQNTNTEVTSLTQARDRFVVYSPSHVDRSVAELAVKKSFRTAYQADISEFLPVLITAQRLNDVNAVVGLRPAAKHALYVEHYLAQPIEDELKNLHGLSIRREQLVEIGNLISNRSGMSHQLFIILAFALAKLGFEWVTFTATQQVEFLLKKMKLVPITLCEAKRAAIASQHSQWGSYYQQSPKVCYGNVTQAVAQLATIPAIVNRYQHLKPAVEQLVSEIKQGSLL